MNSQDLEEWRLDIKVLTDNPLYTGQTFRLLICFPESYPVEVPRVQFINDIDRLIPIHPHIYSNGHICLDMLGPKWTPIMNVSSICISIQSMLTGNERNGEYSLMDLVTT